MSATFNQVGTDPGININAQLSSIGFGSFGYAQDVILGYGPPTHADLRTNFLSYRTAEGSGYSSSPAFADIAGCFIAAKANWTVPYDSTQPNSAQEGEVDGLYIIARQGDKGDVGGVLVDVAKVEGPSGNGGYQGQTPIEAKSAVLSRTQSSPAGIPSIKKVVQAVIAFNEDNLNGSMQSIGICSEMRVGEGEAAFAARLFDESGGLNTVGPAPSWKWSFVNQITRAASSRNFGIDGAGRVHFGTLSETKILESSGGFLRLRTAVGAADIFAIDTAGNVHLGDPADKKVIASSGGRFTVNNVVGGPALFSVDQSGAAVVANILTVNGGVMTLATTYTKAQLLTLNGLPTGSIALCSDGNGFTPAGPCLAFLSGSVWYNSATNAPL
jgi:hypothetical protein